MLIPVACIINFITESTANTVMSLCFSLFHTGLVMNFGTKITTSKFSWPRHQIDIPVNAVDVSRPNQPQASSR